VTQSRSRPVAEPVLWRQVVVGLALFGVYLAVDSLDDASRQAAARRHGHDVFALEQRLHIGIEHALNDWLAPHHLLSTLANYEYATTYIIGALALLAWVWVRRPDLWVTTRDSFVVMNLLAIATFALYPTAPPRMLHDLGFVDTVMRGGTVGSWGSGIVDAANQVAAMPSLHVGWALWVSVVLARITARRSVQALSAVHVALTVFVVLATANHYLLDAVAVVVPVAIGVAYAEVRHKDSVGEPVASCDGFFLHVEETGAAQHVGGFVVFAPVPGAIADPTGAGRPSLDELRRLARTELVPQRRFHQRLSQPTRWRRLRWVDTEVDVDAHLTEVVVDDGMPGLRRVVAEYAEQPMPRERPLWRVVIVRDTATGRSAMLFLVHHAMADGISTIIHSLRLFRPRVELAEGGGRMPGSLVRAGATIAGLGQLAVDGRARRLSVATRRRGYATADLNLASTRALAQRHGVRVTDLVLALVTTAIRNTRPELAIALRGRLRVAVPMMVRAPGAAPEGNATAAVMVDLPLDGGSFEETLAEISRRTRRLRRPTRAIASRFVMATGLRMLPEPAAGWFARTVYGGAFFHGIVSNLPGPGPRLEVSGHRVDGVYPILPVAPGAPFALGAMSWAGAFGWGIATDQGVIDAAACAEEVQRLAAELGTTGPVEVTPSAGAPAEGEEQASA